MTEIMLARDGTVDRHVQENRQHRHDDDPPAQPADRPHHAPGQRRGRNFAQPQDRLLVGRHAIATIEAVRRGTQG